MSMESMSLDRLKYPMIGDLIEVDSGGFGNLVGIFLGCKSHALPYRDYDLVSFFPVDTRWQQESAYWVFVRWRIKNILATDGSL